MNEVLFFIHLTAVLLFSLGALRLGREALTAWVALQALLANLFVLKQISFFGFEVTCSDVFAVGSILCLNLLREYFGKEASQKAMALSFYALLFFALMAQFHLFYTPSPHDTTHSSFAALLSPSPRLLFSSLAVFLIVQQLDMRLFGLLKKTKLSLSYRNGISVTATQLLDTVLFSFIGLYGLVESMSDIIVISFAIKLLIICCATPFTALSRRFHAAV